MNTAPPSDELILRRFAAIVGRQLRAEPAQIRLDTYMEDLGASSLDLVEITLEAEQEFHVLLAGKSIFDAAVLTFGPGVLEVDGEVTEEGKKLILSRFPHLREGDFGDRFEITDLQREITRVRVWVESISELVGMIAQRCEECDGKLVSDKIGFPDCEEQEREFERPSLEDLNVAWISRYYEKEHLSARSS